jgi:hypothetical protein
VSAAFVVYTMHPVPQLKRGGPWVYCAWPYGEGCQRRFRSGKKARRHWRREHLSSYRLHGEGGEALGPVQTVK